MQAVAGQATEPLTAWSAPVGCNNVSWTATTRCRPPAWHRPGRKFSTLRTVQNNGALAWQSEREVELKPAGCRSAHRKQSSVSALQSAVLKAQTHDAVAHTTVIPGQTTGSRSDAAVIASNRRGRRD